MFDSKIMPLLLVHLWVRRFGLLVRYKVLLLDYLQMGLMGLLCYHISEIDILG